MTSQKVLVTGASGFIGTPLCRRLCANDIEVHAVSRKARASEIPNLRWWAGDLSDLTTVRNIFREVRPEVVFHLASHVDGSRSLEMVGPTFYGNLATTVNLLTVSTEIGCTRLVLTGSLEEPDLGADRFSLCSPYAAAKWASSAYGRMFHELYQTPVVIAKLFMVYGPAQQDLRKLVPYVTLSLLKGESPKLSSGERLVDWIYVDDVINGFLAISETPGLEGSTLDLGCGTLVSIREVVREIVRITGSSVEPLFGALPDRPFERVRKADLMNTCNRLDWKPVVSLQEGLERTVKWYKEYVA